MTGIDLLTRDVLGMPAGFAVYSFESWGDDYPVSGDEIARMRAEDCMRAL